MYSILIVDDEENVIRLLNKVFIKEGYHVYTANNANEALQTIDIHQVDLVVSDIRMSGMDGIELLGHIKKIDSNIKVVLITAFATVETAINALKMGASDYFTKPFNLDELIVSVKNLLKDNSTSVQTYVDSKQKLTTKSQAMQKVLNVIKLVADSKVTAMLYGETGTGKELAAQTIHELSARSKKPFIKVNCAAIPDALLESELFGYEKGAFTGAIAKKTGRFELADEGTIFLDEIGDIALTTQVKLLRVLQEREFERLGGIKTIKTDVRIIAATNKKLDELVKAGSFREDLYYRLNVVPIILPTLKERKEDSYKASREISLDEAVDDKEREIIITALRECSGNRTKTSEKLGISRRSLHRKLIKYSIEE